MKGCRLYAAHVLEAMENETPRLEDFHVLQEFKDVFPDEVQDVLQRGKLIIQLTLFLEQHQCLRHPTG